MGTDKSINSRHWSGIFDKLSSVIRPDRDNIHQLPFVLTGYIAGIVNYTGIPYMLPSLMLNEKAIVCFLFSCYVCFVQ